MINSGKNNSNLVNEGLSFFKLLANSYYENSENYIIYRGIVVDIDENGGKFFKGTETNPQGTIKSRIPGLHRGIKDNNLPLFYPLLPSHLNLPDIGEYIWILFEHSKHKFSGFWIDKVVQQKRIDLAGQDYKQLSGYNEKETLSDKPQKNYVNLTFIAG